MGIVGRLDQYASMLAWEFDETTANNPSITGLGTYYATEFNENIVDIVRDGLVLNLDAGNLASYSGSGTTWTDLSGNSNTGTLTNGPTYSSANGGSIVFDGADDYVLTSTINHNIGTGNFTYSAWVYPTSLKIGGASLCAFMGNGDYAPTFGFDLNGYPSQLGFYWSGWNGFGTTLSLNQWHCVTMTRVGTLITGYLNANACPVTYNVGFSMGNAQYVIGRSGVNYAPDTFKGNISQVSIYNRALSASEIQQNYNALATRFGLATTNSTAPMTANVFAPYDPVYDEFSGTSFGAGQGRYMRQNTDKSVIVYNEIDEVTDFYGRGIVRDGLVLDLDAGITASYPGSGTTWTDLSASGNIGTLVNGVGYNSGNGGALVFDGTNDVVNSTTSIIDRADGQEITVSCWIKPSRTSGQYSVFCTNRSNDASIYNWIFYQHITDGAIAFHGDAQNKSSYVPTTNVWINVTNTVTASGVSTLYVNGVSTYTVTGYTYGNGTPSRLGIGADPGGQEPFQGNISQVSIYNRALTAAEILQNYNALRNRFQL